MPTRKTTAKKTAKKTTSKAKTATKSTKKAPAKKKTVKKKKKVAAKKTGDEEVTIDRRRNDDDAPAPALERREKVQRRRQIDPTTCERDYSDQEVEFMSALDDYKRKNGRMFPTCSEVLEVIRGLGYVQLSGAELAAQRAQDGLDSDNEMDEQASVETEDAEAQLV